MGLTQVRGWRRNGRGTPTPVRISNVCAQVQRLLSAGVRDTGQLHMRGCGHRTAVASMVSESARATPDRLTERRFGDRRRVQTTSNVNNRQREPHEHKTQPAFQRHVPAEATVMPG